MLNGVLEVLTGAGLATSAGLNAYIPMLAVGLLSRYTDLIDPPSGWQWLSNGYMLVVLGLLLAIEVVADKVPTVDHVNDVIQTVVRPSSGGIVFGAASGAQTVTVNEPSAFLSGHQWIPVIAGILIAFVVHGLKATARPAINAMTFGVGAPIASVVEDVTSVVTSIIAIVLPILVVVFMMGICWMFWSAIRRRRQRKADAVA